MEEYPTLTITDAASKKLTNYLETEAKGLHFRIEVLPGGCSGYRYRLGFDEPEEGDLTYKANNVPVAIDKKSAPFLVKATIDYSDTLNKQGFIVKNEAAKRTCGCGESFS